MIVIDSKVVNEHIIIAESRKEYDECKIKAKELNCALYTKKEIQYLVESIRDLDEGGKKKLLQVVNKVKKEFEGFLIIPKGWSPANK